MTTTATPPLEETALHIDGMTCGACVASVDKALRSVPGVRDAAVNLTTGMASVTGHADSRLLLSAVGHAGYSAKIMAGSAAQTLRQVSAEGQQHQVVVRNRLIVGAIAGIPVVLIDLLEGHLWSMHSTAGMVTFPAIALALATIVMLTAGIPFFTGVWRALRHLAANMDVLVALGTGVAYLYSLILQILEWTHQVPMHAYHSELHAAVTIVVLVTLGKYLEARAKRRASSAVANLARQTAATASKILADGSLQTLPAEQLAIGDRLQVLAHQILPVDGEVLEGTGSADLSVITGESLPIEVHPGTQLPGGATLSDGRIILRATSTAAASTVARILDLVNTAQTGKTQIQGLADRVAAIFVPIVLLLSAANFGLWILATHNWEHALITTIATIVIACPCAMGLATPTAITVAMGTAARHGILFTKATALETARAITTVVFDKTGTLTEGHPRVVEILPAGESPLAAPEILQRTASIEQFSEHPLARAILSAATAAKTQLLEPASFHSIPGGGVEAAFDDGQEFIASGLPYLEKLAIEITAPDRNKIDALIKQGHSLVLLAQKSPGKLLGIITLRDQLRADAGEMMLQLKTMGIRIGVLSGDSQAAVTATLKDLPIDFVRAQVKPEEKAAALTTLRNATPDSPSPTRPVHHSIAFVGDGINDAPALAAADLGIAMATGTDLAKSAGDVLLTSNRLTSIPLTLTLARRTLRIIKQNLFWAFAYNIAAIPLAMLGILPPGIAAGAMILSSLTVVGNALRLRH